MDEDYLSNIRFAESVIRNKVSRGYGWNAIRQELKLKKVWTAMFIQSVLDWAQAIDWYWQAEQAYQKRFGAMRQSKIKKTKPNGYDFYNTAVSLSMSACNGVECNLTENVGIPHD